MADEDYNDPRLSDVDDMDRDYDRRGSGRDGGSDDEKDGGADTGYRRRDRDRTETTKSHSSRVRTPYERPQHDRSENRDGDDDNRGSSRRTGGGGGGRDNSDKESRVYCGNLPYECSWQQLKDFMREAGEVVFADVLTNAAGRSKGCGIVEFSNPDEARKAIETLNDKEFLGRPIFIREDRESDARFGMGSGAGGPRGGGGGFGGWGGPRGGFRGGAPRGGGWSGPRGPGGGDTDTAGRQLFVGNLPYVVGWTDLKDLFRGAGSVVRADINETPDRRPKGTGIVLFETEDDAKKAIEMFDGYEWHGRRIEVREDRFAGSSGPPRARGPPRGGWGGWGWPPYGPPPRDWGYPPGPGGYGGYYGGGAYGNYGYQGGAGGYDYGESSYGPSSGW